MNRYLIVKTSECRLPNGAIKSNFGDLLRTTTLLDELADPWLWLTDLRSLPLLEAFVPAHRIVTSIDEAVRRDLSPDPIILNADNTPLAAAAARRIKGEWRGYLWNGRDECMRPANESMERILPYALHGDECVPWQQALVEGMGFRWKGQDYALPRLPTAPTVDIGLNSHAHPDWTAKHWPHPSWEALELRLRGTLSVTRQEATNDLPAYVRWMASCRVVITCDSLGMHLGSALRKKIVALVGPTASGEYDYGRVTFLRPAPRHCMPCNEPVCRISPHCMNDISVDEVFGAAVRLAEEGAPPAPRVILEAVLSSDGRIHVIAPAGRPAEAYEGPLEEACRRVLQDATAATRFLLRRGAEDRQVTCGEWMRQVDEYIERDRR